MSAVRVGDPLVKKIERVARSPKAGGYQRRHLRELNLRTGENDRLILAHVETVDQTAPARAGGDFIRMVAEMAVNAVRGFVGVSNAVIAVVFLAVLAGEMPGDVGEEVAPLGVRFLILGRELDPLDAVARKIEAASEPGLQTQPLSSERGRKER